MFDRRPFGFLKMLTPTRDASGSDKKEVGTIHSNWSGTYTDFSGIGYVDSYPQEEEEAELLDVSSFSGLIP